MPDISSISTGGHPAVGSLDRVSPPTGRHHEPNASPVEQPTLQPPPERPGDRVELSEHARYLDQIRRLPSARLDRIDAVRSAIARGEYETEDRLHSAIDRILEDLTG